MKILYVDDSFEDFEMAKFALKGFNNLELIYAKNFIQFKELFYVDTYEVIFSDYNMPDVVGTDIFEFVRKENKLIPFVIISGELGEEFAVDILRMGITDYVLKNGLEKLPIVLERVLQESKTLELARIAEQKLVESEEKYRSVVEDQLEFIVRFSPTGKLLFANRSYLQYCGISFSELAEWNYFDYLKHINQQRDFEILNSDSLVVNRTYDFESSNEEKIWQEWTDRVFLDQSGNRVEFQSVGRDISAQRIAEIKIIKNEKELSAKNKELSKLTNYLQLVREEERTRIARDVHDELGQLLAGLKMQMMAYQAKHVKETDAVKKMNEMIDILKISIDAIHKITSGLRPKMLDDLGLFATLEWSLGKFETISQIKIDYSLNCEEPYWNKDFSSHVYRIIQESLTNATKYSKASIVNVNIYEEDGLVVFEIKDNGIGFDVKKIKSKNTFGLLGMQERTKMLNGIFKIISAPNKGTTVQLKVPKNSNVE